MSMKADDASVTPAQGELHLYALRLAGSTGALARCRSFLDEGELRRCESIHAERDTRRFVVGHGVLRALLAHALKAESPRELHFGRAPGNKPRIVFPRTDLRYNISHSGDFSVYAIALGAEVGIDIEKVETLDNAVELAWRFFCREEAMELQSTSESDRLEAFYRCWTRKEAYVKAIGTGLAHPLKAFRVSLLAGEPARIISLNGEREAARQWMLAEIPLAPGHVGAAACASGFKARIRCTWQSADEALAWLDLAELPALATGAFLPGIQAGLRCSKGAME